MSDLKAKVVILGAGHAGGSMAAFLRQSGHEGPIVLIGDEPIPPYQRPPLSKAWLKGEADAASLALKDVAWYADNGCDLRLGVTATAVNRGEKAVTLSTGETVAYDILVFATGARARKLDAPRKRHMRKATSSLGKAQPRSTLAATLGKPSIG